MPEPLAHRLPRLTQARCELTREIQVLDACGVCRPIHIPQEHALTIFVDKQELVTVMTLGQAPELLVLGYLLNQRLVADVAEIESVTVDWEVGAAAVRTRSGVSDLAQRTAHRVVTTGCGQGTVYADLLHEVQGLHLPDAATARVSQAQLELVLDAMRAQDSIYRRAGSVHGSALWQGSEMLMFVEDVGRHNAIDSLAGWMALRGVGGGDKLLYTTGRLTSEMVMKAARIGVPILVSRNGITGMGLEMATRLGMALFGRASSRRFLCYTGAERLDLARPQAD